MTGWKWFVMTLFTLAGIALILWQWRAGDPPRTSGAMAAMQFWNAQRAYPADDIPAEGLVEGFAANRALRERERDRLAPETAPWRAIGPHNFGGRTLAVAFNPQNPATIYAGSASGGLWRSTTAGAGPEAWEYVPTGFPLHGVSSIAFAPNDSNVIYIGTGEVYNYRSSIGGVTIRTTRGSYGIGILKSTDGGATWSKSLDWSASQERGVWSVIVNPLNPNTVWATTTEGTFRSRDAGATWDHVHTVIMGMHMVMSPADTNTVFVGYGNLGSVDHGIYRTTDGGATWTKLSAGLPTAFQGKVWLSIYEANPDIVYASIGNGWFSGAGTWLVKSTDGGDTWTTVNTFDYATYQGWFAHFVWVPPADSSTVLTAGVDIFKSTNGGANLSRKSDWASWYFGRTPPGGPEGPPDYSHADHHFVVAHPGDPDILYFGNDGGVFRTLDGGETFEGVNGGYQTQQFYNGFSSSWADSNLAMGGMQDNASAIYDGSVAWRRVIGGDGAWTAMHPADTTIMFGSYQNLSMLRSDDYGASWFFIAPPSAPTGFIAPYRLAPSSPDVMYAGRSVVYRSTSGGLDWSGTNFGQPLDGNPALAMAVSDYDADVVYVSTAPVSSRGRLFRTLNGGELWSDVTGTLPDRYLMDIAVHPGDHGRLYVVAAGYGSGHVFRSDDFGASWSDVTGDLPDVPTTSVAIDPDFPDHVYVGNDIGAYVSLDGGVSWSAFQEGMADAAMVVSLSVSPLNRMLRAATHGRGAFERPLVEPSTVITDGSPAAPADFVLQPNYPNPFNPATTIAFRIAETVRVTLTVYDLTGRRVATLVDGSLPPGRHSVRWEGKNDRGESVASGTYLYRLQAGERVRARTMTLAR